MRESWVKLLSNSKITVVSLLFQVENSLFLSHELCIWLNTRIATSEN